MEEELLSLPLGERGFLYGDGCFDTFRFIGGRVFMREGHLSRSARTAAVLGLPEPGAALYDMAEELCRENGHLEGAGRLTISRGPLPAGPKPDGAGKPTILITTRPLPKELERYRKVGRRTVTVGFPLRAGGVFPEGHKTLCYLGSVQALAKAQNGEEPLLETIGGHLSEGAASNIFWVSGGILFTPSLATGCLPGVMREATIEVAKQSGIEVREGKFPLADLLSADEAFLTNSVTLLTPVSHVDDSAVKGPLPGPITASLMGRIEEMAELFRRDG